MRLGIGVTVPKISLNLNILLNLRFHMFLEGLGFRVWGLGFGVQGLGFRVWDWGMAFRV